MTPQTPPTDRPLTAGDVPLLREGDALAYGAYDPIIVGSPGVTIESIEIAIFRGETFTFVARPATSAASEVEGVERTIGGESVLGFKVAAWRFDTRCPQDQDKEKWDSFFGKSGPPHTYCEHWSTPGAGASNVERLFTETQLRAALASPPVSERERELEGALRCALQAMEWAQAHIGGDAKYESAAQVENCLADYEESVEAVRCLFTAQPAEGKACG